MGKSTACSCRVSSPRRVGSAPRPFGWPSDGLDDDDHISYKGPVSPFLEKKEPVVASQEAKHPSGTQVGPTVTGIPACIGPGLKSQSVTGFRSALCELFLWKFSVDCLRTDFTGRGQPARSG